MKTWIALLRGINVGGHNKLSMAELRTLCSSLSFGSVATYIQSGNVVFRAEGSAAQVAADLAEGIRRRFGPMVPVVVRSAEELERVVGGNPFLDSGHEASKLHVGFLEAAPAPRVVAAMPPPPPGPEEFRVIGADVYLLYPDGMGRSKLTGAYFERALGTSMTVRNWRTVTRLAEMAREVRAAFRPQ